MAGFLYFVESKPRNTAEIIAEYDLGYALDPGCVLSPISLGASPSGKPGCLLADGNRVSKVAFRPKQQTWKHVNGLWVGMLNDDRPTPTDLLRPQMVAGYPVILGDGNQWIVPLVRQYNHDAEHGSRLPHSRDLDENGNWVKGPVLAKYEHLVELTESFFDRWDVALREAIENKADDFSVDDPEPEKTAVKVLSANYVISDIEVALLRLLQDEGDTAGEIMWAACDCRLALSWILSDKKKEADADGLRIGDGVRDSTKDMPQLMQT